MIGVKWAKMLAECYRITGLAGKIGFQGTDLEEKDKRDMWADYVAVIGTTWAFRNDTSAAFVAIGEFDYPRKESIVMDRGEE